MVARGLLCVSVIMLVGCAPKNSEPVDQAANGRVANALVRAEANAIAKRVPNRCVLRFAIGLSRPWEANFERSMGGGLRHLSVSTSDRSTVQALLSALRASTRKSSRGDPIENYPGEPHDFIEFYNENGEIGGFHFHVEELEDEWGAELAKLIEPIYKQQTAKHMPKVDRLANVAVRAKANAVAKRNPNRCSLVFTTGLHRPWEANFEKFETSVKVGLWRHLSVNLYDRSTAQALLRALQASTRKSTVRYDPIESVPVEPHDFIVFFNKDGKIDSFPFHVEALEEHWGAELAKLIEPIYRKHTEKHMPKQKNN